MIISEIFIKLIILFLLSIVFGLLAYTLLSRDTNYLKERLKRGNVSIQRRSILDEILELIKPITHLNLKDNKNKITTKQMLIKLGLPANESDIIDFENRRIFGMLVGILSGIFVSFSLALLLKDSPSKMLLCIMIIILPTYINYKKPNWELIKKIKSKEKAFEKYFADAIDLLCVCVEAGLSIDSAIERVGREFSNFSKEVGFEFNRISKDMVSGVSKQDALRGLAERVTNKDIQSFVAIIIQADKMGASISNSLAVSADSLRTKRKQRLEAQVSAASTKMTIPLVLFLLPATFVVVLTPAVIQVIESMGKVNAFM